MKRLLDMPVLVLNRLWQPVNTCSARRAVSLLCIGHAQVVQSDEQNQFYTHDFESWIDFSETSWALADVGENSPATSEFLHSVKLTLKMPRIIVLSDYDRLPKKEVKFTRQNIFQRDKHTCQYCGIVFDTKKLNLDHVVPRDKGGKSSWDNLVTSCISCNTRKSNKMPAEARMFPLRTPVAPRWRPFSTSVRNQECHESWRHFLDISTSQVEMSA